jgi:hypothetical protein
VPVAADVGGHSELVTPDCGRLIGRSKDETEEIGHYTAAIRELLHHPDRLRAMGDAGQSRVRHRFDIRRMAEGMDSAFRRAEALAMERPGQDDLALGRYIAHIAVETERLRELSDQLWSQRALAAEPAATDPVAAELVEPDPAVHPIEPELASDPVEPVDAYFASTRVPLLRRILPYHTRRYVIWKQMRRSLRL